ncbi:MAG: hypothetical protein GX591_01045, partial [Planctomycetes bacterium]|nr:hypothetical protein [Planctomycetota bacterium]
IEWSTRWFGPPKDRPAIRTLYLADARGWEFTASPDGGGSAYFPQGGGSVWPNSAKVRPLGVEAYLGGRLLGCLDKRIDEVIREGTFTMRVEHGDDGGVAAYVVAGTVAAERREGSRWEHRALTAGASAEPTDWLYTYQLRFDPAHGFNLAEAVVDSRPSEAYVDAQPTGRRHVRTVIEVPRFEQIEGVWVAMEAAVQYNSRYARNEYLNERSRFVRSQVKLNPDFEALDAFSMAWVPEGAVFLSALTDPPQWFIWRDGQLVPRQLPKPTWTPKTPLDTAGENGKRVAETLAAYRHLRTRLHFSGLRIEAESTIAHGPAAAMKYRREQSQLRWNPQSISWRARTWGFMTPDAEPVRQAEPLYAGLSWAAGTLEERKRGPHETAAVTTGQGAAENAWVAALAEADAAAALLGILADDRAFVDAALETADAITALDGTQKAAGVDCVVLEATRGDTFYRLWFAPGRDGNLVKAEVARGGDHPLTFTLDNVALRRVHRLWVPVGARIVTDWRQGGVACRREVRCERTDVELPSLLRGPEDFALSALGDFRPGTAANATNRPPDSHEP